MNESGTGSRIDTDLTQPRSGPVRYRLIDKDGNMIAHGNSATLLADLAKARWPDQEQDPERTGKGWDVEVVNG